MKVYIARAEHYAIPGSHLSVHKTTKGAKKSALVSLNILRADLRLRKADAFSEAAVEECQKIEADCDVWIDTLTVKA